MFSFGGGGGKAAIHMIGRLRKLNYLTADFEPNVLGQYLTRHRHRNWSTDLHIRVTITLTYRMSWAPLKLLKKYFIINKYKHTYMG